MIYRREKSKIFYYFSEDFRLCTDIFCDFQLDTSDRNVFATVYSLLLTLSLPDALQYYVDCTTDGSSNLPIYNDHFIMKSVKS